MGFAPSDPGGNWLRIDEHARAASRANETTPRKPDRSALATALYAAGIRNDSKDDPQAATNLLDKALPRAESPHLAELVAALVYRAELAARLEDQSGAARCIAQTRAIPLDDATRTTVQGDLERADELWQALVITGEGCPES